MTAILNLSGQVERRVTSLLFFLVLVCIEELIRALETKFHQLSKHLACLQKNFLTLKQTVLQIVTGAVYSVSMKSIFARAVIGSPGVVTNSINTAIMCSIGALVDI